MEKFKYWLMVFLLLASQSLYALTTLTVTQSTDNDPGGMGEIGDLRYVINTMNQGLSTTPDDYAIVFAFPMTIQLNGILPVINNSLNPVNITIGNSGSTPTVTIDGNSGAYSGFFIPMGNVTIQNINFQNLTARGGTGGDGISGGGGGLGAGGAIYVPQTFLNGSNPSVTLINVTINSCAAVGGNGGNYFSLPSPTGNEGGGGGGGFSGNGGSILTTGITGGAGGGGFGGDGGDVTLDAGSPGGGGGGGGGGFGSRATLGVLTNLGNGGSDQSVGQPGNALGLAIIAGAGGGGNAGGNHAGGGGGGGGLVMSGGGGGGSSGGDGLQPRGSTPPLFAAIHAPKPQSAVSGAEKHVYDLIRELKALLPKHQQKNSNQAKLAKVKGFTAGAVNPSGGNGGDGAGAGGGGVVTTTTSNNVDGQSGSGGYGGGGGGGAGTGAYDPDYTVQGGSGGLGGGGGGGGVNQSGATPADGGGSLGGGGGGGGGPSSSLTALGGSDLGSLGGGAGGAGANNYGTGFGGGGGGGGSGLGGAVFVDSGLNFTIQAFSGIPSIFNTPSNTTQAGLHGLGGAGGADGFDGSALGNSIFLRTGSSLTLRASDANDVLTLGAGVAFSDDTNFGTGGTIVYVRGNGTVIYNGTTDYQGVVSVYDANFKVNGEIDNAPIFVCRQNVSSQRGTLSGSGTLTGSVFVNSGTISPDAGQTLTLGSLTLNSPSGGSLGSLVHVSINAGGAALVAVTGAASLAGRLDVRLEANAVAGQYTLLTSSGITGTFDSVTVTSATGKTPNYTLSYLPAGAPTYVQLNFTGLQSVDIPATVDGSSIINPAVVCCGRPVILGPLPVPGSGPTIYTIVSKTGNVTCQIGETKKQTYLKMQGNSGSCTISGTKDGVVSNPLTVTVS